MEDLKVGDIREFDGVKRIVTGFSLVAGTMYPDTEPYVKAEELKCQYCGKVCKNALGLASHEDHCKENPKNQGA
jgi:hypothetical protein